MQLSHRLIALFRTRREWQAAVPTASEIEHDRNTGAITCSSTSTSTATPARARRVAPNRLDGAGREADPADVGIQKRVPSHQNA